ncbi:anthranilate synthase component I [Ktedonobacter sp. SOSP1-52]|uniref:anthranilate synthase component I n=1 Tax=Ktedonobacter sp. SOSP1-52 TaxID=2778366 RepID=UPI001914E7A7|nr:anthranilate synthase component I [Ktedonobacter sp. SOSP1-52]GHO65454.1 anthranilate synthase component I [Ktedonobacter sp. SOSP1-52]
MYHPTYEEIKQLHSTTRPNNSTRHLKASNAQSKATPIVPLYLDVEADIETPVSAYCKVAQGPYCFLLESVIGGERLSRYSTIGVDPHMVISHYGEHAVVHWPGHPGEEGSGDESISSHDPLTLLQTKLDRYQLIMPEGSKEDELTRFYGGAVGYLSYEAVACFEQLPVPPDDELQLPLAIFCFTKTILILDQVTHRIRIVTHLHLDAPDMGAEYQRGIAVIDEIQERLRQELRLPEEPPVHAISEQGQISANCTREQYEERVRRAQEYIQAGDIFQVVPSLRLSRSVSASPFTVYRALRSINPSPYMFYLDFGTFQLVGTSPELLISVKNGEVATRPIAGTRPRGKTLMTDLRLEEELLSDTKERAEHVMLVDLGRNDIGRVSTQGSVYVTDYMGIERYSHVMHLASSVKGQLREGLSACDALRASFPAGTVSGAPKIRAMEIISELEGTQRGAYAGAIGTFSYGGNLNTAITLRTLVMKNDHAYIQAGAGIVADSNPAQEYQECINKASAMLHALEKAECMAETHRKETYSAQGGFHAATH